MTATAAMPKWRRRHNAKHNVKWRGVVKVQRSLFTSEAEPQVLIYSQDESVRWQGPLEQDLANWWGQPGEIDEHKFYAVAELRGTIIRLIRKTTWRDW